MRRFINISISRRYLADELNSRLERGIVVFTYRTKNGHYRKAIGTKDLTLVRRMGIDVPTPQGKVYRPNAYYDLEKKGWRSYIPQNVLSIQG